MEFPIFQLLRNAVSDSRIGNNVGCCEEITGDLTHRLERLNAFRSGWMGRKHSAAGVAITLHQPSEGVDHSSLGITRTLQQLDGVAVGR